jgi:hypothetical protein
MKYIQGAQPGQVGQVANKSADNQIVTNYYNSLIDDLKERGIIDATDIENINAKIKSNIMSVTDMISSLEQLKKTGKTKPPSKTSDDRRYNELPNDFYAPLGDKIANDWENEYTILNTNKWQVPVARPPVCINTTPCKVCPSDDSSESPYGVSLSAWDNSRVISNTLLNKQWAASQTSA